ncbi:AAA domain-containing protein [Streptomyces xiamenensis]|uniref:AAA domain-containing protein n=1 Tax=Streptomyces xiamenensis TaxID=408015 RepID=UPI003449C846
MNGTDPRVQTDRVIAAAHEWADELIDLGPRNTLLHFRNIKTASLELTGAAPEAIGSLVAGKGVRLRELFPDAAQHRDACNRARGLRRRLVELSEEQGVEAGGVGRGLLRVDPPTTRGTAPVRPLRAPLLLHPLVLRAHTASETDYVLEAGPDPEINPVLLYALSRQFGVDDDIEELSEKAITACDEFTDPSDQTRAVYDVIAGPLAAAGLSAELEDAVVAGVFSFDRLPMVNDLRKAGELLAAHPVVAALAGDERAKQRLAEGEGLSDPVGADALPPRSEYLVQDADASQQRALSTALSGEHLVIEGPPGTGKSQTIANLIAGFAALGQRVLFVAEKRAAIEAVTDRLARVDLDGLVFDLHGNKLNKRLVAQQLAESLDRAEQEPRPSKDGLHEQLDHHRGQATQHVAEFHRQYAPWGVSAYEAISRLSDFPDEHRGGLRLRGGDLEKLAGDRLRLAQRDLRDFVSGDGLRIRRAESPWSRARIRNEAELRSVVAILDQLTGTALRDTRREMEDLVASAGLSPATDISGWQQRLGLLGAVAGTLEVFDQEAFGDHLDELAAATGERAWRTQRGIRLGWWQRHTLLNTARKLRRDGVRDRRTLHAALVRAQEQRTAWRSLAVNGGAPSSVEGLPEALGNFTELRDWLAAVALHTRFDGLESRPQEEVDQLIQRLQEDRSTLMIMPEINQFTERLEAVGLAPLLDELARRNVAPDVAVAIFDAMWWSSVLDEITFRSPHIRTFKGDGHDYTVAEFRREDAEHIRRNAQRVRYKVATRLRQSRDSHPEQSNEVRTQARRKSRHMPLRKLVQKAPDVLLAAKPCWAMSPLVVSRLLPLEPLFDVVIFDEASQILPSDAITSILRARRVIVAGDPKQLPPSTFFQQALSGSSDEDEDDDASDVKDFESLLDMLGARLPRRQRLRWHYRSSDERLIAFSNREIYGDELVTFPGTAVESPVRLEVVDGHATPGQSGSAPHEVERVVALALEHAAERPGLSLGVITMGRPHADRIEMTLRKALSDRPELQGFFSPDAGPGKRFFIKSLEQVQGDERDAIILSIGYAKAATGRLSMNFGPLSKEGGERRLNVAVSRAREAMTVVSSFSHEDFDPRALEATRYRGPKLLSQFLQFCAHRGDWTRTASAQPTYELNGFERQILAALEREEIPVVPQWGVSGYRIDFALAHPERPGQMVLAVEADGDRYHRAASARDRDRLRQEHLERLGWRFHRIWAADWFRDPQAQTARVVKAWREAVRNTDADAAPVNTHRDRGVVQEPAPEAKPTRRPSRPVRRLPHPRLPSHRAIKEYTEQELFSLAHWILSDGYQLDRDSRIAEAMTELGFKKRGKIIVARLTKAFEQAQRVVDKEISG